jgi:hypothetical protein
LEERLRTRVPLCWTAALHSSTIPFVDRFPGHSGCFRARQPAVLITGPLPALKWFDDIDLRVVFGSVRNPNAARDGAAALLASPRDQRPRAPQPPKRLVQCLRGLVRTF